VGDRSILLAPEQVREKDLKKVISATITYQNDLNLSLAEILRENGYVTVAIPNDRYSNYLSDKTGVRRGFDINFTNNPDDKYDRQNRFNDEQMTDRAIEVIQKYRDQPFFLWLHYYDQHSFEKVEDAPDWGDRAVDRYDNGISKMDQRIGRVLAELKRQGLEDDSILIFTADHGAVFTLNAEMHGTDLSAAQIQVPLIIRYPEGAQGTGIHDPVGLVDLMPTVLDILNIEIPKSVEGWSLKPLMEGEVSNLDRYLFVEGWRPELNGEPYIDQKGIIYRNKLYVFDRFHYTFQAFSLGDLRTQKEDLSANHLF